MALEFSERVKRIPVYPAASAYALPEDVAVMASNESPEPPIPEVIEAHTMTGPGDLHCRLVARSNQHLQEVINRILEVSGIERTATHIALTEQVPFRVLPLVDQLGEGGA